MLSLKANKREKIGRKTKILRKQGVLPAVFYGEGVKNTSVEINEKEFEKIFEQAGTSSLLGFEFEGKTHPVLIYDYSRDPLSGKISHIDFYKPSTKKEIIAKVVLEFLGEAPAEKDLGGNLIKEIQEIEVRGLAHNLPKEIKVKLEQLKTFQDRILVGDLEVPEAVKITRNKTDIVALVVEPRKEKEEAPKPEEIKGEKIEEKPTEKNKEEEKKRE